ncbi:PhoD-like phosphatase N-terminal domain-containing protein, partial [Micromonospora saelicesensis]|uniref:PhoD-like phosphatase N-terminal domain-containing protein n=1 Tax=Micromonospora saelicesensis TaxID=285676 RepID=UPI0015EC2447
MTELDRRTLLRTGLVVGAGAAGGALLGGAGANAAPAWRPAARPVLTHGVQLVDVPADSAVVWTRADRPGRMLVEVSRRPDFRGARKLRGPLLRPNGDFTGKVRLRGRPDGARR